MDISIILQKQTESLKEHKPFAVATIVSSDGSTPRSSGKMLVFEDGTSFGTIGGGTAEAMTIKDALICLRRRENAYKEYDLSGLTSGTGMICGGRLSVLIECFAPKPLLVILGAGHVGFALLRLAGFLGYETLLADDRAEDTIKDKIALADRYVRLHDFYGDLAKLDIPEGAAYIIATHDHAGDGDCLAAVLPKKASYIGMIGSRIKIEKLFERLKEQGCSGEQLESVYTPMGLDLGGETPEEIALAVMAEIQKVRCGRTGKHLKEKQKGTL